MEFTKNVEDIKLSERTKQLLIKLAAFDESFFELCELLIYKSDNEELQAAFENEAEKEQKKAMEYQANALKEVLEEPPVDQEGRLIHVGVMLLHPVLHAKQAVGSGAELLHISLPQLSVVSQLAGDGVFSASHG